MIPIATPDSRSSGTSFFIFENEIFCLVSSKNAPISTAAIAARYNANSPDETEMFLTKMLNVPKMAIEEINISRGFIVFFITVLTICQRKPLTQSIISVLADGVNCFKALCPFRLHLQADFSCALYFFAKIYYNER